MEPAAQWRHEAALAASQHCVGEFAADCMPMVFLIGALPVRVHAYAMRDLGSLSDTVTINLQFSTGSLGSVCYFANVHKRMSKEHIEVYKEGQSAVIEGFLELTLLYGAR
jgi:predicted dehydrogenase